jgi:RNA polymerase sigma-70 factor (ECF subfamily)
MSDDQVIQRVLRGETGLYADLILRYQRRLQSTIYPILHDDAEVEDAIQEGHVHALAHLAQFAGRSSFLTWMTRIMIHEAFAILRRRRRLRQFDDLADPQTGGQVVLWTARGRNPEQQAIDAELRHALAQALRLLPEPYRAVFTLREIEEISTADAAGMLGISEECVRIRLHRARALLRGRLAKRVPSGRCRPRPTALPHGGPTPGAACLP